MKLLNLFFVCLILFWGATALADPPPWNEYPLDCTAEHGVCFEEFEDAFYVYGTDMTTGDQIIVLFEPDTNDYMRQNPDGSTFLHLVFQEITDAIYCPLGVEIPAGCWPLDISYPASGTMTGFVGLLPDGDFFASCPYSGQGRGVVTSPSGEQFRMNFAGVLVSSPDDNCRIVRMEINAKPMR